MSCRLRGTPYLSSDANMERAKNARAFSLSDDDDKNAGSHSVNRLRIATWNLRSLRGHTQELAEPRDGVPVGLQWK